MSKMREAFDREFPDAKDPLKIIMLAYFEAGYQAAIAAVKEGGPAAIVRITHGLRVGCLEYRLDEGTELYCLSDDLT